VARTNIEIDNKLLLKVRNLTGLKTKSAIVDKALRLLIRSETRRRVLH